MCQSKAVYVAAGKPQTFQPVHDRPAPGLPLHESLRGAGLGLFICIGSMMPGASASNARDLPPKRPWWRPKPTRPRPPKAEPVILGKPFVSVLEQDFPASDRTPEIVRKFEPRVRLLRKENGGQASAFNAGIPECSAKLWRSWTATTGGKAGSLVWGE